MKHNLIIKHNTTLNLSLHDVQNQILYLDDTKTGNNRVILTPNMIKAYKYYTTKIKIEFNKSKVFTLKNRYIYPYILE